MHWPFVLLGVAICFVWLPDISFGRQAVPAWVPPFLAAVATGLAFGVLSWPALLVLAALVGVAWRSLRAPSEVERGVLTALAAILALALALHLVPGFNNPKLFDAVRLSADAAPFTQYLNFDKGTAGLILLAAYAPRVANLAELRRVLVTVLAVAAGTALAVIGVALAAGYVRVDFKIPPLALAFLATNLLFTCVTEEAFFRGLLQERLARGLQQWPHWRWLPVAVSSLLFGLAHAAGGGLFVALTTLAGIGYSLAYALTRRIEAAVLTHFAVNALQFVCFTYPYLMR